MKRVVGVIIVALLMSVMPASAEDVGWDVDTADKLAQLCEGRNGAPDYVINHGKGYCLGVVQGVYVYATTISRYCGVDRVTGGMLTRSFLKHVDEKTPIGDEPNRIQPAVMVLINSWLQDGYLRVKNGGSCE